MTALPVKFLHKCRVLVTQTPPSGENLAGELAQHGAIATPCPLAKVQPLSIGSSKKQVIAQADYWIFLSAHTVRIAAPHLHYRDFAPPIIAVGPSTKEAILQANLCQEVHMPSEFSRFGIAQMPLLHRPYQGLAIFTSKHHSDKTPTLRQLLKPYSQTLRMVYTHQLQACDLARQRLLALPKHPDVITVHSALQLTFLKLHGDVLPWIYDCTLCVVSETMRQEALSYGFLNPILAQDPTPNAILEALITWWHDKVKPIQD